MAILNGIHYYTVSSMPDVGSNPGTPITLDALIPAEIVSLMSPAQNYVAYRQHYLEYPGIPFLIPHIRDYKKNGDTALQPVFQYLQR
jgi:hypothetical protein